MNGADLFFTPVNQARILKAVKELREGGGTVHELIETDEVTEAEWDWIWEVWKGDAVRVSEVKKILRENDCYLYREGSRHEIWISRRTGKKFQIPRHASQEVPAGTLQSIRKSAGLEKE